MNQPLNVNGVILTKDAIETLIELQENNNDYINEMYKNCNTLSSIVLENRSGISPDPDIIFGLLENINTISQILSYLKAPSTTQTKVS